MILKEGFDSYLPGIRNNKECLSCFTYLVIGINICLCSSDKLLSVSYHTLMNRMSRDVLEIPQDCSQAGFPVSLNLGRCN